MFGIQPPEVMALGAGIGAAGVADAKDLRHDPRIGLRLRAKGRPVAGESAFDRIVDRGAAGRIGWMEVAMKHG